MLLLVCLLFAGGYLAMVVFNRVTGLMQRSSISSSRAITAGDRVTRDFLTTVVAGGTFGRGPGL